MPKRNQSGKNPVLAAAVSSLVADRLIQKSKRDLRAAKSINPQRPQRVAESSERKMRRSAASASTTVLPAPVAAGMMMRGANYGFSAAPMRGGTAGVRVSGRQIWCSLNNQATASSTTVITPYGSNTAVNHITFDPDDIVTMPPPMLQFSTIFGRYVLRKCRVIFTPQAGTGVQTSVSFAVNTDAAFVQSTTNTFSVNLEQSNSAGGPVWAMSAIDVPCDDTLRYTYQSVSDASLTNAEERQDHAFGMWAATSGTALTASTTYGYFHIEYVIDFYEVQVGLNEASIRQLERRLQVARWRRAQEIGHVERKEVKTPARDGEEKEPSPSLEDLPQSGLSGGWSVVPTLLRSVPPSVTVTPRSEQAGTVKSRSLKA